MKVFVWLLRVALFIVLLGFAVKNSSMVTLHFFFDAAWPLPLVAVMLIFFATGAAAGLSLQRPAFWPVALGALLFLISDLILAAQLFNGLRFRLINETVWLTYGPGQMLIVFGMGLALYSM